MSERPDVTKLLGAIEQGDPTAAADLLPLVYDELRRLAAAQLAREGPGLTLQPTALVHEAYLRLVGAGASGGDGVSWQNRGHFFGAAAQAMRRILVDRARRVRALKHGGGQPVEPLHDNAEVLRPDTPSPDEPLDLLALDEALDRLAERDERQAQIVMLRYFAGLTVEETAAAMDLSPATVKNEWTYARAWLRREIEGRAGR